MIWSSHLNKRRSSIIIIFLSSLLISGCSLQSQPAGLDINTAPSSKVFIDGKESGSTPLTIKHKAGEVSIKLAPESGPSWESKVKLVPGIETVIRQEFGEDEAQTAGEIYLLEKGSKDKASIAVVSTPDAVTVRIDNQPQGFTPLLVDSLAEGEHQIILTSPGFKDRTIRAKTVKGYKLSLNVKLSQERPTTITPPPTDTPTGQVTPTPKLSPTPSPKITPTPQASTTKTTPQKPYIEILDTPTGYLRVRSDASTSSPEVARVNPGDKYPYLSLKTGTDGNSWYKITYATDKEGYVVSTYSKKVE